MKFSPAFQFYPSDWLSSGKVSLMKPEYEGAYIRLLAYAWLDPDCSIPDDDDQLASLSRLGEGWFKGGSQMVRACFIKSDTLAGRLVNIRLLHERKKQAEWKEKSRIGGINSSQSRRNKSKGGSQMVDKCLPPKANSPSSSPSSSNKREKNASLSLPLKEVFDSWNALGVVPQCLLVSDKRRRMLEARLREPFFVSNWRAALEKVRASKFCQGQSERGWKAPFEWFISPDSVAKLMEGKYDGVETSNPRDGTSEGMTKKQYLEEITRQAMQ